MTRSPWLLLALPFAACSSVAGVFSCGTGVLTGTATTNRPTTPVAPSEEAMPTLAPAMCSRVLEPASFRFDIASLPAPFASESARRSSDVIEPPSDACLNVPANFRVNVFAEHLENPRWMVVTPSGDVLITDHRHNRIGILRDLDGDGRAETQGTFASEEAGNTINLPHGMAFHQNQFYVANTNSVVRYDYVRGELQVTGTGTKIADLPGNGYNQHWTRNILVSPDGNRLFVGVGSETNADEEELPRAAILSMNLDGSDVQVFASGLRNPVGMAFHPQSGELYASVNERDELGDDLVPDYFTHVERDAFYGWPYAYLAPTLLDPRHAKFGRSARPEMAMRTRSPDVLFQAHSAALGVAFAQASNFPERYRNGAFVAFRGSWNRASGTGYKIVFVPFGEDRRPLGGYEDFLTGFLLDPQLFEYQGPTVWGRPVGLVFLPDGSLLLSEEANGRIYRISYRDR